MVLREETYAADVCSERAVAMVLLLACSALNILALIVDKWIESVQACIDSRLLPGLATDSTTHGSGSPYWPILLMVIVEICFLGVYVY